jgi:uncharacterized membrane protein
MPILILLLVLLVIAIVVLPFVAVAKASAAERIAGDLARRIGAIEDQLRSLKPRVVAAAETEPARRPEPVAEVSPAKTAEPASAAAVRADEPKPEPEPEPAAPMASHIAPPAPERPPVAPPPLPPKVAPVAAAPAQRPPSATPPAAATPPGDWEQFMGAKLFAWIGGLALFLGVAFFVKYSFEHNLIPPPVRAAIGFLTGIALIVGGVRMRAKATAVTAQTLCATGVLILYTVTFACRAFYHFPFFTFAPTFALMALITLAGFLLAVRMNAIVIAVLGMAGGFLTPVLLSTGQDMPLPLFGYIALLDIGLLAVAHQRRWTILPVLGAVGTVLVQIGWIGQFFAPEKYFEGGKTLVPMAVFAGFQGLFLCAAAAAKRRKIASRELCLSALGLGAIALLLGFFFLSFPPLGHRPALLFGYVFLVNLGLLAVVLVDAELAFAAPVAGLVTFSLLAAWTGEYLTIEHLNAALAAYFVFALFHSAAPIAMQRLRGTKAPAWCHVFPAIALGLVLIPIFKLDALSFAVWPFVLLVDVLAILLAVVTGMLLPVVAVLVLTLVAIGGCIFHIPDTLAGLPTALFLIGGFAVFFVAAAEWAARRVAPANGAAWFRASLSGGVGDPANLALELQTLSATLPFLLLVMVVLRLPLTDPSPVFGLALLLVALLFMLAKRISLDAMPAVALACVLGLENAWHFSRFDSERAAVPLAWYLAFYAVFAVFPFVFHRQLEKKHAPWAVAALAGPLHFFLVHQLVRAAYPAFHGMMGLLPAAFALPALAGLAALARRTPADSPARNAQLAWFGGVALFFITLIFPIQFDREWITIGWAVEGAALCWLFRRVPHPGLRVAGVALLAFAFARLALNPAVLGYHPRAAAAIFNWYLYAYGIVTAAQFAAARLLAPPRNAVLGRDARPLLCTLGAALAFLLVNVEIADYFTPPGAAVLTFEFAGNLARDMSYSIAWALFALLLLVIGIWKKLAPVRYASLGLLGVTVLKLFLHDLSELDQLYRIGAFVVVAIIAILASFLYQRFFAAVNKEHEAPELPSS